MPALLPVDPNSGFMSHFGPMRGLFFRGEMKFGPMDVPLWDIFGTTRFLPLFSELG